MKSSSQILLTRAWWKKEAPQGLKKSGPLFERALDDYARAEASLDKGNAATFKSMDKAVAALDLAAREVAKEARDLTRTTKDKAVLTDLDNTVLVMAKPFARAMDDVRARMAELNASVEDDDATVFGSIEAHKAFLMKYVPKLKQQPMAFAFGITGKGPAEARFNFHLSKEPKALAMALKAKANAERFTYGRAGTGALTEALGQEEEAGRTLVLNLEFRTVKGLAKRAKKLFREMGFTAFAKVVVMEAGVILEQADDATMDLPDVEEEGAGAAQAGPADVPSAVAAAPPPPDPATGAPAVLPPPDAKALLARYKAVLDKLNAPALVLSDKERMRVRELSTVIGSAIKAGDLTRADKALTTLESRAAGNLGVLDPSGIPFDQEHAEVMGTESGLTPKQTKRLEDWLKVNFMAEVRDGAGTKYEVGGDRMAAALDGSSDLGSLTPQEKYYLTGRVLRRWIYTPQTGEDGASENLSNFTQGVKDNPDIRGDLATLYLRTADQNQKHVGGELQMRARDMSVQLYHEAIDLDPDQTARHLGERLGGAGLAELISGNRRKEAVGDVMLAKRGVQNPNFDPASPDRQAALVRSVGNGSLPLEQGDAFMSYMFGNAGTKGVQTPEQQAAWAEALGNTLGRNNCLADGPTGKTTAELQKVLATGPGRDLLFNDKIPAPYRNWAVNQMAPNPMDPGHKTLSAEDVAKGWESPALCKSFAGTAIAEAKKQFPAPVPFDPAKDKGALANMMGQSLGLPPNDVPKGETPEQEAARLDQGMAHGYYKTDEAPLKTFFEIVKEKGLNPVSVTPVPITWTKQEAGPSIFKVMRVETPDGAIFFDHHGNRFTSAKHWLDENKLPTGTLTYPADLVPGAAPVTVSHENDDDKLDILDKVVMGAGIVAGVAVLVGTGGLAAPIVAGAAAGYSGVRAGQKLSEKSDLGHDIGDLGDAETRGLWLDAGSSVLSIGAIGGGVKAARMLQQGTKLGRGAANIVAGMSVASNVVDAAAMADNVYQLQKNWDKLTPEQKTAALLQLGFQAGMGAASARAGGGKFSDGFSLKRTRNQLEHGSPFDLKSSKDMAEGDVRVNWDKTDPKKPKGFFIEYGGDKPPSRLMIELHSRAASAMEASVGLKKKLSDMIGGERTGIDDGSSAWEANFEIGKIHAEAEAVTKALAAKPDPEAQAKLKSRLEELENALVKEQARLDEWTKEGTGFVGAPSGGATQAKKLGWPDPPKGHHWVAGPDGQPFLRRNDAGAKGERMHYDPKTKKYIPDSEWTGADMRVVGHGENEVGFKLDKDGRTTEVTAKLRKFHVGAGRTSDELAAQAAVGAKGIAGDDAGHAVGHRFDLDKGAKNLFPQDANFNRGAYKTMENEFADWIAAGCDVDLSVKLSKYNGDRPEKITVTYSITDPKSGKVVYENGARFDNDGKQSFKRLDRDSMDAEIAKKVGGLR